MDESAYNFREAEKVPGLLADIERLRAELARVSERASEVVGLERGRRETAEAEVERLRAALTGGRAKAIEQRDRAEAENERLREENEFLKGESPDVFIKGERLERHRLTPIGDADPDLETEVERLRKAYDAKCAEFETAKEPVFAEGMRQGCEDLMMEAARMADQIERLTRWTETLAKTVDQRNEEVEGLRSLVREAISIHSDDWFYRARQAIESE